MAYVSVQGTVTRTFHNGKGAEVVESFTKRDGSEGKTRWAAWFESEHGLSEGDTVEVSGLHGDQVDEWTDKEGGVRHSVKRSLNRAKIKGQEGTGSTQSAPEAPQASSGGYPATNAQTGSWSDEETPF